MYGQLSFEPRLGVGSGRRTRRRQIFIGLGLVVSTAVGTLELFQINPADWFVQDPELFRDAPRFKGVRPPTLKSLELKNEESLPSLETYIKRREGDDSEDQDLAALSLRKALRNERGTASRQTTAYLEALEGDLRLRRGDQAGAIQHLEKANRRYPGDLHILDLLLRAHEETTRKLQERKRPWPIEVQERIRTYSLRADELRREIRRLQAQGRSSQPVTLASGEVCVESCSFTVLDHTAVRMDLTGGTAGVIASANDRFSIGKGSRRALLVGINGYDAAVGLQPLSYAVRDAVRVAGGYDAMGYSTSIVTDRNATREHILGALLHEAAASRPGDEFIFYFSGHGSTDVRGQSAIFTAPTAPAEVSIVALSEVDSILSYHRGKVTVVVDGCQNRLDVDLGVSNQARVRGANRPVFVLAGARGGVAVESGRLRSSLFTESLLRHLRMDATTPSAASSRRPADLALWRAVADDTEVLARKLYGVDQRPQVYRSGLDLIGGM